MPLLTPWLAPLPMEQQIVTVDVSYTVIVAWSESDGMYAVADGDDKPSASGELRGLMLHPGLPTVYVSHQRLLEILDHPYEREGYRLQSS